MLRGFERWKILNFWWLKHGGKQQLLHEWQVKLVSKCSFRWKREVSAKSNGLAKKNGHMQMRHIQAINSSFKVWGRQFGHLYKRMLREMTASFHPWASPRLKLHFLASFFWLPLFQTDSGLDEWKMSNLCPKILRNNVSKTSRAGICGSADRLGKSIGGLEWIIF